jgi:hypothetical protein
LRMVHSDGDLLRVAPTKMATESLPLGERFRLPEQSTMNFRLPKLTIGGDGECH